MTPSRREFLRAIGGLAAVVGGRASGADVAAAGGAAYVIRDYRDGDVAACAIDGTSSGRSWTGRMGPAAGDVRIRESDQVEERTS